MQKICGPITTMDLRKAIYRKRDIWGQINSNNSKDILLWLANWCNREKGGVMYGREFVCTICYVYHIAKSSSNTDYKLNPKLDTML